MSLMDGFLGYFGPNTKCGAINGKLFSDFSAHLFMIQVQFFLMSKLSAYTVSISRQYQNIISVSSFQIKNKTIIHYANSVKMKSNQLFNNQHICGCCIYCLLTPIHKKKILFLQCMAWLNFS